MKKISIKNAILKYALKQFPGRKRFCPLPFRQMEIMPGGNTCLCCYIKKSPGKIKGDNLLEVYNSSSAREIRASILDGTFRYCDLEACPHFSAGDLPLQKDCARTPYESVIENGSTIPDTVNLWMSFDRRCNLRCISCRKNFVKISPEEDKKIEGLMGMIKANLSKISRIGLNGSGEPFASPSLCTFLNEFNATEYPDLKITILTNGLLFNEQAWDLMKKGRTAIKSVQVSIDAATRESYGKIRIGGSFEKLMKNMEFISQLRRQNLIKEFIISFVVNSINFSEMDAFVSLGINLGCDQVYFSSMGKWGGLSDQEYMELAIHLPAHKMHQEFRKKLENPIFNHPTVLLGNIKRFQSRRLLRDSLFS